MSVRHTARARWAAATVLFAALGVVPATGPAADAAGDACGATMLKADGTAWSCSFSDDFNGATLDTTRWVPAETGDNGYRVGMTCFDPEHNIKVADGELHLTVSKRVAGQCSGVTSMTAQYVGAALSTWGNFAQTYGRWEVRMRYPTQDVRGLWGGFWANPRDRDYGRWPASGEIDVAEWMSGMPDQVVPTLHYTGSTTEDTGWDCGVPDLTTFHTYAVEWSPQEMRFYYDGSLCFTRSWDPTSLRIQPPEPFDKPFVPSLLATAGQSWNSPPLGKTSGGTFDVDYVHIWR
ncbi:glycoside hydrolase family 16 protein [Nocardioides jejuensis]|uniref:Glycoside hydrolase family 16 protein n=1 Tax=Nocardioides jejuensis TaxID=2502782 RepID=A0A4R1BV54_9ACTN|nr:glycoside hydrolase family 16 protein [Nocardioides jejuensis]TCJ21839.1 glycoside hydrolase family 16 protein [Nocardioides jejuensis]